MPATMMHMPMSVQIIMRHGATVFPNSRVVEYDGVTTRSTSFADVAGMATQLANALHGLGVCYGDRVGTFCWNSIEHQAAYLAIPSMGAVMHTINMRLSAEQIAYVINHAQNRVLIVDQRLLAILEPALALLESVQHLIIIGDHAELSCSIPVHSFEELLAAQTDSYAWPELREEDAAAVCYTSGTTGNPKGVVYSHRTTYVHAMASRAVDTFGICEADRLLLLPPMFHANSWGMPYSGWFSGSDLIMPGPFLQPDHIATMVRSESPTLTAMVPTVLGDLLRIPDTTLDMSCFRLIVAGGSAVPTSMIEAVAARWGVPLVQGWGMTETSPMCVLSHPPRDADPDQALHWRARSGRPVPGIEVRVADDSGGALAHDGKSVGELQLRGPWVTGSYHAVDTADAFTEDGWLRTGDVGHIDDHYFVQLTDRTKDVIKSGGEWISSVDLENALLAHPAVLEAAVIAMPDARWQERPLAVLVTAQPAPSVSELREFLGPRVARFWIPDSWSFVNEIEKTSVGKIDKRKLRILRDNNNIEVVKAT